MVARIDGSHEWEPSFCLLDEKAFAAATFLRYRGLVAKTGILTLRVGFSCTIFLSAAKNIRQVALDRVFGSTRGR